MLYAFQYLTNNMQTILSQLSPLDSLSSSAGYVILSVWPLASSSSNRYKFTNFCVELVSSRESIDTSMFYNSCMEVKRLCCGVVTTLPPSTPSNSKRQSSAVSIEFVENCCCNVCGWLANIVFCCCCWRNVGLLPTLMGIASGVAGGVSKFDILRFKAELPTIVGVVDVATLAVDATPVGD
ncbi:hypothetical protein FF38_10612 [Lucilia cuprina]|uniref:Uncharacterized protein n=1 Tax=Lucilia cuprina TaxID=7375 RepID=A0A0L0BN81_LUCCU|nr:hypothetical protein FF38_10612 [Lucilia cuprina]